MTLRGSYSARIDDRNRLKVPIEFRRFIEANWGSDVFVTSQNGADVQIYPIPVWEEFESRLLKLPLMQPARMRVQKVVNYFGKAQQIDAQGRILIHSPLKESARIGEEVMVLGFGNHLHVQDTERVKQDVTASIESDLETFSDLWRTE
jgi:division/cell wall cluster transcriptional repressor MraZ